MEGMTLFSGNNLNDNDIMSGGTYNSTFHEAKYSVLFGDGTAGGRLVFNTKAGTSWGWMQWRPNQYFRVKIGSDGDGEWGHAQIVGWGFTGEAKNSVAAVNDYNGSLAMKYRHQGLNYGGFDGDAAFNLGLSFWPVEMLRINVLFRDIDKEAEISERFARMQIGAMFTIEEAGVIRFAAVGSGGLAKHKDDGGKVEDGAAIGMLHLAFYSNQIVQGLAFEAGLQYDLPHVNASDIYENIQIGAGINLTSTDPFNLKIRTGLSVGGKQEIGYKVENEVVKGDYWTREESEMKEVVDRDLGWGIGILPSYKLPKLTIFLHAGFGMEMKKENKVQEEEFVYNWFINPYIWVPMGGMRMWIGIQILDQHVVNEGQIGWNIPFGFNFYF
jgi:hypothetical protein